MIVSDTPVRTVVRVDASPEIGLGHATRAFALAAELRRQYAAETVVVARDDELLRPFVDASGASWIRATGRGYGVDEVLAVLDLGDVVVSDTYELDEHALDAIAASGARHLVVDDFGDLTRWPCDVVVNPNVGAESIAYPGAGAVLVGPRFALLRPEVLAAAEPSEGRRSGILVCLGGGDWPPESQPLLEALGSRAAQEVRVTTRGAVPEPLVAVPPEQLPTELRRSSAGLLSAGVVKYEAALCGLPAVLVAVVQHQERIGELFAATGSAVYGGSIGATDPSELAERVLALAGDDTAQQRLRRAGRALVDGRGAERAVRQVLARPH